MILTFVKSASFDRLPIEPLRRSQPGAGSRPALGVYVGCVTACSASSTAAFRELGMLVERIDVGRHVPVVLLRGHTDLITGLQILRFADRSITGELGILGQRMRALL